MKVATYTRISTDEERQPFFLEAQGDHLSAYIASQAPQLLDDDQAPEPESPERR